MPHTQYLRTYAEPEARLSPLPGSYDHVVVIPACGEGSNLLQALGTVPAGPTLAIVVINGRVDAPDWVHERNASCVDSLISELGTGTQVHPSPRMRLMAAPFGVLLLIERHAEHRLPPRQGVGLARKIGCDVALAQIAHGVVRSRFIHCTDADVQLPVDYFTQTQALRGPCSAAIYAFLHIPEPDPALRAAIEDYEASLRYYVHGLQLAGSPYAFQSIGSTVAVDATAYAQVRGFPRRDAAEDFYLLDKLAKVGPVRSLAGNPLRLAGRVSQRVPFGTGKAMWRLITGDLELQLYHPATFTYLRTWLQILERAAHTPLCLFSACAAENGGDAIHAALQTLGTADAIVTAHAKTRSVPARRRFLHTWFDGFRTLKFIHALREQGLRPMPLATALTHAPFAFAPAATHRLANLLRQAEEAWARHRLHDSASHDTTQRYGKTGLY